MGAYLNKPVKDKVSADYSLGRLKCGTSSMQGWRTSQEDAHNCCLEFDKDTSLFGVYDGHGGAEVATYTAEKLPDFIKTMPAYKDGNIAQALEDAFLQFDAMLLKDEVISDLKELAGLNIDKEDEADFEEADKLCEEAIMPMEELMKRYQLTFSKTNSPTNKAKLNFTEEVSDKPTQNELNDPLVNGHSEKTNSVSAADTRASNETKDSEKPNGNSSESNSVPRTSDKEADNNSDSSTCDSQPQDSGMSSSRAESSGGPSEDCSAGGSSGSNEQTSCEPCSSSGRTRVKKTGIIPKEGEDESSFDEDEEDTEEEEDSDEDAEPWKSGSDDEDENDHAILRAFVHNDEEEEEEEEEDDEEGDDEDDEEEEDDDDDEDRDITAGEMPGRDSGCTAVVAVLHKSQLYVANAGDSRCVLSRGGKAIDLSVDHKPEDELERRRVEKAGGRVTKDGRINGGLNLSRAIGDHLYKQNSSLSDREQMITALPDIRTATLGEDDEFIVLACDGIWNVVSSQDVVTFVRERLKSGVEKLSSVCEEMFDLCLAPDTSGDGTGCDNMTCIIVTFGDHFLESNKTVKSETKPADEQMSEVTDKAQTETTGGHSTVEKPFDSLSESDEDKSTASNKTASKRKTDDNSEETSSRKMAKIEEDT